MLAEPIKRNTWMSSDQVKHQTSAANRAGEFDSPVNTSSKVSKNTSDDTSDSPSSIIEEIIDNGNETANDDDIDHFSEHAPKLEHTAITQRANETIIQHQSNDSKKIDPGVTLPTSKSKSTATVRLKSKADVKQKTTAVIKAKTSSPVNSNNKLKSAKSSVKQASILQTDGNKDKHRSNTMDATTSTTSPQPPTSSANSIEVKSSNTSKSVSHEMKSVYATPASPTAGGGGGGGFNTLKTDLPGRVSFSKNDVYEIDYSDIDNDTDTSRSFDLNEPFRKKNVHFEDEYFNKYDDDDEGNDDATATTTNIDTAKKMSLNQMNVFRSNENRMSTVQETTESNSLLNNEKDYCRSSRGKSDMRLDVLPEDNENASNAAISNDSSQKIIDEYKREIESINRQHELERRWNSGKVNGDTTTNSEYLNNVSTMQRSESFKDTEQMSSQKDEWQSGSDTWSSPNHETNENVMGKSKVTNATAASNTSDESPTRDSASTVINNYLKITNQRTGNSTKPSSATIKLKTTKKLAATSNRKIKSAQVTSTDNKPSTSNRLTKAKSVGHLQRVTDIKLSEFQIDKVESWMSTHGDTFSDAGLNSYRKYGKFGSSSNLDYKKTWRETPTSKTDDEGNYSLDDQVDNTSMDGSIGGGIELVLKKLEGRRMQISFGTFFCTKFNRIHLQRNNNSSY